VLNKFYLSFWSDKFLNFFCLAIFASLIVGLGFYFVSPNGNTVKYGDFPAFYVAAKLSLESPELLYDLNSQAQTQVALTSELGFHVFAYPPFFALFLEPLATQDLSGAKLLYLGLLAIFVFASGNLLKDIVPVRLTSLQLTALLFLFPPLVVGFSGGQNTAFSLLLLISIVLLAKNKNWLFAGVLVGLWNFKPQYSVIAFIVLYFQSETKARFVLGYLLSSTFEMLVSFAAYGKSVFLSWFELLKLLTQMNNNSSTNIAKMTSIVSVYRSYSDSSPLLGLSLSAVGLALLFLLVRKFRDNYSIVGVILALLSPQTGFYDLALILPFLLTQLGALKSPFIWRYLLSITVIWGAFKLQELHQVQILPIVVLLVLTTYSVLSKSLVEDNRENK